MPTKKSNVVEVMKRGDLLIPEGDFWHWGILLDSLIYTGKVKDSAAGGWTIYWYEFLQLQGDKIVWVTEELLEYHTWQVNGVNVSDK